MQPSARQQELERIYQSRKGSQKGHVPHISISDDSHHVTEAIGSYYGDEQAPNVKGDERPLSYMHSPSEVYESRGMKRGGGYFGDVHAGSSAARDPMQRTRSSEKVPSPSAETGSLSPKSVKRMGSMDTENRSGGLSPTPSSPPPLTRQTSTETANQQFPLNDIDYESSPAAVAQELSNLQAIRRMSMNVDTADPDLPSFGGAVPTVAPKSSDDDEDDDEARLFWVPASVHPELAPKEFRTFIEDRVDKMRRRSGDSDSLSVDGLERSGSTSSSLRRKKSMLSHQIDTKGNYEDGAERLERKRSKRVQVEGQTTVANLAELEELVNDPQQLIRRMSLDTVRRSQDSGIEVPATEDMPILPPGGQFLKRSTRTTYRRGSLKKGERAPLSKRAQHRQSESEAEESPAQSPVVSGGDEREPILGLTRVQTEPTPSPSGEAHDDYPSSTRTSSRRRAGLGASQSSDNLVPDSVRRQSQESKGSPPPEPPQQEEPPQPRRAPQPKQFHSRLASGPGRTTAQLPGYHNNNPLPHIIETLPDGTKVPVGQLAQQQHPERKSSHELPRPMHRGGAHMRPVPGRQQAYPSSTLDDISSHPSPLPGSGSTRTDALTMVPTFEDKKIDKKDGSRKSSWKWILGNDDDDKEKKAKEEKALDGGLSKSKSSKLTKAPGGDKARLDVLQNSIDGTSTPARGRESLVLNRADVQLEDERKKETKKSSETKREKEKEPSLLSTIFGGKKKTSEGDLKDKKRKSDHRGLSPEPPPRILKPDIDYNWTRFSILEERAIYRMAHIKLANPRRALYSQVLLSNFMYSYLAKVQMMHPQMQIPAHAQQQKAAQQRGGGSQGQEQQPAEYSQYQRWQEQQSRQESGQNSGNGKAAAAHGRSSSYDIATSGGAQQQRAHAGYDDEQQHSSSGYDRRSSEEYDSSYSSSSAADDPYSGARSRVNGIMTGGHTGGGAHSSGGSGGGGAGSGGGGSGQQPGYSVASTHDYLGYPKDQQPFGQDGGALWEDEKAGEELW
ncbi:hypothetical protein LTR36_006514 [Oleoguttula mirabilis]|uniref:Protein Zds1 C-terminal domain-containing protein n=1 Tax=Oleoguttula mirabilis TaxID=1507867 RepID=A0AAV9JVF1_9PEZI|nr:hypothetical protein LTR36_006514 [Oleoguttula mirabilis]